MERYGQRTETLVWRIKSEFDEMPGLTLTGSQAQRLFGVDADHCQAILGALVQGGFLRTNRAGSYVKSDHAA
jgi:hypothetical protein